jgi:hypothetical protein
MKMGRFEGLMLAVAALMAPMFLTGCGDFWQAPSSSNGSFTLTNSGNITAALSSSGTSTITVTPATSFTGTVTLSCSITATPTSATNIPTCALSETSLDFTSATAQTSTLTATTDSGTTAGAYTITITGVDGSVAAETTACLLVATSATSCTSTAGSSGNFYILDGGSAPGIVGKSIASGTLTSISGSPWLLTSTLVPTSMAIAPNGDYLVVGTTSGVFSYPIASGSLGTGVQLSQDAAFAVQVDTSSSWVVEAVQLNSDSVALSAIPVNASTGGSPGTLRTGSFQTASIGTVPTNQMTISGDNSYVFVALGSGGTLVAPFSSSAPFPNGVSGIDIHVANSGGAALSVAVDPGTSPRLLYIGESLGSGTSGGLRAFNYSSLSGTLSQATGSPIASGGLAPVSIQPISTGDYLYVGDGTGAIDGFSVSASGTTYTIASTGSTASAGNGLVGLAEDSSDTYLFSASSEGSPYFDAFTFDSTTAGKLDSSVTSTSAASSVAIVAAP